MRAPISSREELRQKTDLSEQEIDLLKHLEANSSFEETQQSLELEPEEVLQSIADLGSKLRASELEPATRHQYAQLRSRRLNNWAAKRVISTNPSWTRNENQIYSPEDVDRFFTLYDRGADYTEIYSALGRIPFHHSSNHKPAVLRSDTNAAKKFASAARDLRERLLEDAVGPYKKSRRAYRMWSIQESAALVGMVRQGATLDDMMSGLERTAAGLQIHLWGLSEKGEIEPELASKAQVRINSAWRLYNALDMEGISTLTPSKERVEQFSGYLRGLFGQMFDGDVPGYNFDVRKKLEERIAAEGRGWLEGISNSLTGLREKFRDEAENVRNYIVNGTWESEQVHEGLGEALYTIVKEASVKRPEIAQLRVTSTLEEIGSNAMLGKKLTRERVRQLEKPVTQAIVERKDSVKNFLRSTAFQLYDRSGPVTRLFIDYNQV